jgi:hypothetical protein
MIAIRTLAWVHLAPFPVWVGSFVVGIVKRLRPKEEPMKVDTDRTNILYRLRKHVADDNDHLHSGHSL